MTLDYGHAEGFAAASREHLEPLAAQARILVVEDDDNISALLGRELRGLGHTVDTVRFAEDERVLPPDGGDRLRRAGRRRDA